MAESSDQIFQLALSPLGLAPPTLGVYPQVTAHFLCSWLGCSCSLPRACSLPTAHALQGIACSAQAQPCCGRILHPPRCLTCTPCQPSLGHQAFNPSALGTKSGPGELMIYVDVFPSLIGDSFFRGACFPV